MKILNFRTEENANLGKYSTSQQGAHKIELKVLLLEEIVKYMK